MKPIVSLTLADAREIAVKLCTARGVDLVLPYGAGAIRREVVIDGIALVHLVAPSAGWDRSTAMRDVSVTLPGLGKGTTDVLRLIPHVGGVDVGSILAGVFAPLERTSILPAPSVWGDVDAAIHGDPAGLLSTIAHELEHVSQLDRSGAALWSLAYGTVPGLRAWAEAQGYGQSLAGDVLLRGTELGPAVAAVEASLRGYGLDDEALTVAADVLAPVVECLRAGGVPAGPICEVLAALRAMGYEAREP